MAAMLEETAVDDTRLNRLRLSGNFSIRLVPGVDLREGQSTIS
ncbi:hypothetical protein [Stutzerimonas stutzeri]|nr:hypothetical protein [Stutzerimonas stutzeri]